MANDGKKNTRRLSPTRRLILLAPFILLQLVSVAWSAAPSEWDSLVSRARQEKRVVLGTDISIGNFRQAITNRFAKQFGIDLELRVLEGAQLVAIASRECAAGRPSMDVLLSGNSELISLYPKGCLSPVKPKLILPEVADSKYWRDGALKWNDPEGQYLLQTSEASGQAGRANFRKGFIASGISRQDRQLRSPRRRRRPRPSDLYDDRTR
jgi:hypothetical protein